MKLAYEDFRSGNYDNLPSFMDYEPILTIILTIILGRSIKSVLSPLQAHYVSCTIGTMLDVMGFPLSFQGLLELRCAMYAAYELTLRPPVELPVHLYQVCILPTPDPAQPHQSLAVWRDHTYYLNFMRLRLPTVLNRKLQQCYKTLFEAPADSRKHTLISWVAHGRCGGHRRVSYQMKMVTKGLYEFIRGTF